MAAEWEKAYIEMLAEELTDNSVEAFIEDIDGEPSLVIPIAGRSGDKTGHDAKISIEHVAGCGQFLIMVQLYGDIEEQIFADIEKIEARINEVLTVGNVSVFFEGKALFYNYALVFSEDMPAEMLTRQLGLAVSIIGKTADTVMNILDPFIGGKISAGELLGKGIGKIQ